MSPSRRMAALVVGASLLNLGGNDVNGSAGSVRTRSIHTLLEFP